MKGYMLDHGVVAIFIDHGVDELVIVPNVMSLPALDEPTRRNRSDSEVEVKDVNDMNNNESEVEVDPTYSVCIDYLNGGGDEKIDGARSKFHKMRKKEKRCNRKKVVDGVYKEKGYHSEYYDSDEYGDLVSDEETRSMMVLGKKESFM